MIKYLYEEITYFLIRLTGKPEKIIDEKNERLEIFYFNFGIFGILECICHRGKKQ